jgi:hypothetical protein
VRTAAENLLGAYMYGKTNQYYREKDREAQKQFSDILGSGNDVASWEAAYQAVPEEQRNEKVGQMLGNARAFYALSEAGQADADPYAGLSGEAKNMALMKGRMPTWEEYNAWKNPPKVKQGVDAYGYPYTYTEGGNTGGGPSLGASPAQPGGGLGAGPPRQASSVGASPVGPSSLGASPGIIPEQVPATETQRPERYFEYGQAYDLQGNPVNVGPRMAWGPEQDIEFMGQVIRGRRANNGTNLVLPLGESLTERRYQEGQRRQEEQDRLAAEDRAAKKAKEDAEGQAAFERGRAADEAAYESASEGVRLIDQIIPVLKSSWGGVTGPIADKFPDTSESTANMRANLETIKSMLALETLGSLKAQSRTGATGFGALSEKELRIITSAVADLSTAQSESQLIQKLGMVRSKLEKVIEAKGKDDAFSVRQKGENSGDLVWNPDKGDFD